MFLLSDLDALLWLVVYLLLALVVAYGVLFPVYHRVAGLHPSNAIRMAITTSLIGLLILLYGCSPSHAPYVSFWNDFGLLLNALVLTAPILALVIIVWVTRPKEVN